MATFNWPGFGVASISWTFDQPSQSNTSQWTGTTTVVSEPWFGTRTAKVTLATKQGDAAFRAARAFFSQLLGKINTFHVPAVEEAQNTNSGVTVATTAAQGATSIALTGLTDALVAGNMITVNGQLLQVLTVGSLAAGAQTVGFRPALWKQATSTTAVQTAKPYLLARLSDSSITWDIGQWRQYGMSFNVEEAFGEIDGADPALDVWSGGVSGSGSGPGPSFSFPQLPSFATRSLLAAVTGQVDKQVAYLTEAGREGTFVFSTVNLSTQVSADTAQGLYVAPAAATSGASGAWVRKFSGPLDIRWFGAPVTGDCTAVGTGTDVAPAINGAVAVGLAVGKSCEILIPGGTLGYRVSSTLTFTSGFKLLGQGFHENPGNVGGTAYSDPQNYRGSMLVFDANVKGIEIFDFTDNLANAQAFEFEGARYSIIEDLMLHGGGGTTVTAHGVQLHAVVVMRNVRVHGFAGNGIHNIANTAGALTYGNSDGSFFSNVQIDGNGCHGAYVSGNDANISTWIGCKFRVNGGFGYMDVTTVGCNQLYGCQFASNNQSNGAGTAQTTQVQSDSALLATAANGSICISNASNSPHLLVGTYVETGTGRLAHISRGTLILGGYLGQIGSALLEATSTGILIDGFGGAVLDSITPTGGVLTINGNLTVSQTSGIATFVLTPNSNTFSNLQLRGTSNAIANGLDILGGGAAGYLSADTIVLRNAAQTTTYVTHSASGSIFGGNITAVPAASATPASNGQMTFELTSNTQLKIKVKGSDGVVRSTSLTLA